MHLRCLVVKPMAGRGNLLLYAIVFLLGTVVENGRVSGNEEHDRMTRLPGQPKVSFRQYSGYVTVDQIAGRALFYWLTEAPRRPATKPLVLWLNGGPGCSSVAYGASEEVGPFRINKTTTSLYLNRYSWNTDANLLFLETPAGVGFSYTNRSSDLLDTGDQRTSGDSFTFLLRWIRRFHRYRRREIYLAGESYAGHYIPQLAREIISHNGKSNHRAINLRGILLGNAVMDNYYDNLGTVEYWWSHAMISDETYRHLTSTCDFRRQLETDECASLYNYAISREFGNIDQYNIYAPPCNNSRLAAIRLPHFPRRRLAGYDPCSEKYAEAYFNRREVQEALHANTTGMPYPWTACSETLNRNWNDTDASILPIYREIIAAGLRVWVYSGDVDSVVPVTATRYSLAQLKLPVRVPWYPWYVHGQVGGWTEVYEGLMFATVRGAGHEVPLLKPRAALQLFRSFLAGVPLSRA